MAQVARPKGSKAALKWIIVILVSAIFVDTIFTIFISSDKTATGDVSVTITAGMAMLAAMVIVYRQGLRGLYGKTYAALFIGTACWFVGEFLWTFYEVIAGIELPEASMADIFWLAGYFFFAYHLFKTYQFFSGAINRKHLFVVSLVTTLLIVNIMYPIIAPLQITSDEEMLTAFFRVAYPVGDAMLIVPAVLLLVTLREGNITFTPWLLISIALIITAAADILFSYLTLAAVEIEWIDNLLYDAGNLTLAGALVWYNKFVIYDAKGTFKAFQERNR
jgi:diguanylate cyclase